jgi:polysaccharide export outer membrane protein
MSLIFHRFSVPLLAVLVLSACACTPAPAPQADNAVSIRSLPRVSAEHLTQRGDVLKVVIYGEDDLSGEYTVAHNGTIAMPLVAPIAVDGQPLSKLSSIIADAYRGDYLIDPKVSVEVRDAAK